MFRKSFQKGFLTILYAGGASPLRIWDRMVSNGHIKRVTDEDVRTLAVEMRGTNVATCYIFTPIDPKEVLGITLPFLVMIIKNLKKYFSFEIQILDDRNMRRRFRVSNYQTTTKVRPFGTTMPIGLNPGWNQIQFNLADFTKRAYGSSYVETQRIQIHANCRIRRIYFCNKLYTDEELPNEYKLFYPCVEEKKKKEEVVKDMRAEVPPPSEAGDEGEGDDFEQAGEEFVEPEGSPIDLMEPHIPDEEPQEEIAGLPSMVDDGSEGMQTLDEIEARDIDIGNDEAIPPGDADGNAGGTTSENEAAPDDQAPADEEEGEIEEED